MEWTRERRYMKLEEASKEMKENLKHQVDSCPWRQKNHIQPPTGLLNDPNGFAYYQGEYHLFYQWFPLGPVHGLKYWYHVKSKDLVNWVNVGIGITPEKYYESHGAYSGSAIEKDGNLYLLYTGNHRDENWVRHPMQAIAIMKPDGKVEKLSDPVIKNVPEGYTDHFRDPKVWRHGDTYYTILGAQRKNKTGAVVLYSSLNLIDWNFLGEVKTNFKDFGYMWECPDYFELEQKGVLVWSPQGLEPTGTKYRNIYQSGFAIGDPLDLQTLEFSHGEFEELDRGFDFYAPQSMEDEQGRRILVGWMGLPEIEYPTDKNGWAHCLTLPRELKIIAGQLYQVPVVELEKLRKDEQLLSTTIDSLVEFGTGVHYELECEFTDIQANEVGLNLRMGNVEKTVIKYDTVNKMIVLDRSEAGEVVAVEYGTTREIPYEGETLKLRIFMDTSSLEIFINDGKYTMTSRIFPTNNENKIQVFTTNGKAKANMKKWSY